MNFGTIRKLVTENIGAKIISLLFAVFLWLHVTAQQEESQSFRVPLTLTGIPDSLTIIHDVPEYVEVTIKGARSRLLKMRIFGRLRASVDLSMTKRGRINVPLLSSAVLNLSEELDPRDVTVNNPNMLNLNFERVITKSVPVRIAYKGEVPKDVIITGKPVVIPDKVTVRGAASVVGGINFLTTEEIDVKNKRGKVTYEVDLQPGGYKISVSPQKVLVEMEITKREVRTLANLPPTLLQDDESIRVQYSPLTVSLTIEGPEELIKNIVADDVSIILNVTTKKPGTYQVQPEVIIPNAIEKYWLDVETFEITILPKQEEGAGDDEKK